MTDINGKMSPRERIMAALKRQPVDQIPFVPLIEPFTLMDMPDEIRGDSSALSRYEPGNIIRASRALEVDLMVRNVPASTRLGRSAPNLDILGAFDAPVEAKADFKDGVLTETLTTPVGSIYGTWQFTDKVGGIPHAVKRAVTDSETMKIFHYAVDHLNQEPLQPRPEPFLAAEAEIGDDGIATASMPMSPLMYLIMMAWGLESTYYLLQDHPEEVEDILAKLHVSLKRLAVVLAEGPARVIVLYENTSSTLLSPNVFRRYCLPYLNEYAEILNSAGKTFLVHMCGKLNAMTRDIETGLFNGIVDIPPPPTGDLPWMRPPPVCRKRWSSEESIRPRLSVRTPILWKPKSRGCWNG